MLIDLFQKTRDSSMRMKGGEEPDAKPLKVCKGCGAAFKARNFGRNLYVCPVCGRYSRLLARTRIRFTADPDSFQELFSPSTVWIPGIKLRPLGLAASAFIH